MRVKNLKVIKSAEEIKQWMNDELHKQENLKDYSFSLPKKAKNIYPALPNWTLPQPLLQRSKVGQIELKAELEAERIMEDAISKFELQ